MKRLIAVPVENGVLSGHFGHAPQIALFETDDRSITAEKILTPPPHVPGALPKWIASQGVTDVIAGGIGRHAVQLLEEQNIVLHKGVSSKAADELVKELLNDVLETGESHCHH